MLYTYLCEIEYFLGLIQPVVQLTLEEEAVVFELKAFEIFVDTLQLLY